MEELVRIHAVLARHHRNRFARLEALPDNRKFLVG
jgi:hypothetical protein